MSPLFSGIASNNKHKIDFALVPLAIVLIEFSVFATQVSTDSYDSLIDLILMRIIHTVVMVLLSVGVSQAYLWLKRPELNFQTLALTGLMVIALGDILHAYLANIFGVELVSINRRIGIIVLQGCIWFPVFMIVAGLRREIQQGFKNYEERLIVTARIRSRESDEFIEEQRRLQDEIRRELISLCSAMKSSIIKILSSNRSIPSQSASIRPILQGEDLRRFSLNLDSFNERQGGRILQGKDPRSLVILFQQFRILHTASVHKVPLNFKAYSLVLLLLVAPAYVNFYSIQESLFAFPILSFLVILFSFLVTKLQLRATSISLRVSSLLVFLTGALPLAMNLVVQEMFNDSQTQFLITALVLPVTYFAFMRLLQVLRPSALAQINGDEIEASSALQTKVREIVSADFAQNLSHRWAVFIHGKILTRLAATSLKLETTSRAGDAQGFTNSVQPLLTLLNSPDSDFEEVAIDLQTEVDSRLKPWVGLLDIDISIEPQLDSIQNSRVHVLGEVIEELISNSIRHGKATRIELKVFRAGEGEIEIIATDNATVAPPNSGRGSGLGTRIFNLASEGRWALTRMGSSTQFRLTMGIEI
jgi:signal transduction histidine kinase